MLAAQRGPRQEKHFESRNLARRCTGMIVRLGQRSPISEGIRSREYAGRRPFLNGKPRWKSNLRGASQTAGAAPRSFFPLRQMLTLLALATLFLGRFLGFRFGFRFGFGLFLRGGFFRPLGLRSRCRLARRRR